jgi:ABC-type Fe3+/spermidine/putrescine transport system ATPase subunit
MAEVAVENLNMSYGPLKALDNVSMSFPDGGFFGLLGPSGSGKTTLLRAIAGFVFVDSGTVRIGDTSVEHVPVEKRQIGMVFQNYALFPNMSVADNVGFGLRVRKVSAAEEKKKVTEVLELVQLGQMGERKPHQLSGGQRQRVALARAMVTQPRVLLLDEPLSALDKSLRVDMQIELKRIQREIGITTIFVTHDQEEALTLSDKIGILKAGRMVQSGAPRDVYNRPGDAFTASFLGEANIFDGRIDNGRLRLKDDSVIALDDGATQTGIIAVRPENMTISTSRPDTGNAILANLRQRVFAGAMGACVLDWQGQTLKVIARDQELSHLPENGDVWLNWEVEKTISISAAA